MSKDRFLFQLQPGHRRALTFVSRRHKPADLNEIELLPQQSAGRQGLVFSSRREVATGKVVRIDARR